jgi:hypothetical protein
VNHDLRHAIRTSTTALQSVDLADDDIAAVLPAVARNASMIARLAPRIAFDDEPSIYARVMERAKG